MYSNFVTKSSLLLALATRFRLGGLLCRGFGRLLRGLGLRFGLCLALGRLGLGMFGVLGRGRRGGDRLRLGLGPCGLGRLCPVGEDFGHADEREFLPVAAFPARILPAALLEGDDLRPASLLEDFGGDRGAGNGWLAQADAVAAHHQDLAELYDLAGRALDLVDLDHVLGGDAVLLAAGSDDCEHRSRPRVRCRRSDQSGPASFSRLWALRANRPDTGWGTRRLPHPFSPKAWSALKNARRPEPTCAGCLWRPGPKLSRKWAFRRLVRSERCQTFAPTGPFAHIKRQQRASHERARQPSLRQDERPRQ